MCAVWSPSEEALFEKTGDWVLQRLQKTRNPADYLAVIGMAHKRFDRAYDEAPAAARAAVACRAGCGTCCHVPVGVQAHEVLLVAEHIQTHFTPAALEDVIARVAAHRAAFAGRTLEQRAALRRPCALLQEGSCSVYVARPEACRSHHSSNLDGCRSNLASGFDTVDVLIPAIRARMFAVMLAIDQGAVEAGFDGRAYDFGSALHEALTDSLCVVRWTRREAAFSQSCWEESPDEPDGEAGLLRPEGYFQ